MASALGECRESVRPTRAYAVNRDQLITRRQQDVPQRSEFRQQRPRHTDGDVRGGSKRGFSRRNTRSSLWALRVPRPISALQLKAPQPDATYPSRRVFGVFAPTNGHPEVSDGQNQSPHCFVTKATSIERLPFDQKVGPAFRPSHPSDLCPETALVDGLMKVGNRLALDDRDVLDDVVRDREESFVHSYAKSHQLSCDAGFAFELIGKDSHALRLPGRVCRHSSETEKRPSLAISQGEMA